MSGSGSNWTYDKARLSEALKLWQRDYHPSDSERDAVNEWLMEAIADPVRMGKEDDDTGIFYARVRDTNIAVVYVPNRDERTIYLASIGG